MRVYVDLKDYSNCWKGTLRWEVGKTVGVPLQVGDTMASDRVIEDGGTEASFKYRG